MGPDEAVEIVRHALWTLLLVSTPVLLPVLVVGVLVGILQAATSINETTMSFVPKLLVTALSLALFGGFMMMQLADFYADMAERVAGFGR